MFCEIDGLFFNLLLFYFTDFFVCGDVTLGASFDSVSVTNGVSVADVELSLRRDGVFLVVDEE